MRIYKEVNQMRVSDGIADDGCVIADLMAEFEELTYHNKNMHRKLAKIEENLGLEFGYEYLLVERKKLEKMKREYKDDTL